MTLRVTTLSLEALSLMTLGFMTFWITMKYLRPNAAFWTVMLSVVLLNVSAPRDVMTQAVNKFKIDILEFLHFDDVTIGKVKSNGRSQSRPTRVVMPSLGNSTNVQAPFREAMPFGGMEHV